MIRSTIWGGTDEELDEAGNLLLGKKTEALQMIEACKEYETYYEFCIGTKENSVEKVEGASTTFDRILTLTNMMKTMQSTWIKWLS